VKTLSSLFSLFCLPCIGNCGWGPRFHFSCFRCADRRALIGKLDLKHYHWNRYFGRWLPNSYRQLCLIECENEKPYVLFVDTARRLRAEKDVLLNLLWTWADQSNSANHPKRRKYLLSLCENLAS
jgi:hypothetical protein